MALINKYNPVFLSLLCLLFFACAKSDDQRRFEDEAFVQPQGITQTTADGSIVSDDPDDWNVGPMYQSLIIVDQPAFPNPVDYNSNFTIRINLQTPDAVNQMIFYSFRYPTELNGPIYELDQSRLQLFNSVTIPASSIADQGAAGAAGTYRILIYDGRDNLITYGDVELR